MKVVKHEEKIAEWDAYIIYDPTEEQYTLFPKGNKCGIAIISHNDLEIAKQNWIRAMELSESAYKLLYFNQHGKFPDK